MSGVEAVRAQALEVAAGWSLSDAPESWQLTAALFRLIAGHDDLLARLAELPADRLPALLGSAAIAYLVHRDAAAPLARYFPVAGQPQPPFDSGFDAAARAFVSDRLDELLAVCHAHRYQMNEVARCIQVALGIAASTAHHDGPVALVDVGTGAGLGLQLDRYRYVVGGHASGPETADLSLSCELRGRRRPPPAELPSIAVRAGIDVSPVDLEQPRRAGLADRVRTAGSIGADQAGGSGRSGQQASGGRRGGRRHRDAARGAGEPADGASGCRGRCLHRGIPVRRAPGRADPHPGRGGPRRRLVTWLSLDPLVPLGPDGSDSVQGVALPRAMVSDYQRHGVFAVLGARTFGGRWDDGRLLARAHPSGQWVEWLA